MWYSLKNRHSYDTLSSITRIQYPKKIENGYLKKKSNVSSVCKQAKLSCEFFSRGIIWTFLINFLSIWGTKPARRIFGVNLGPEA